MHVLTLLSPSRSVKCQLVFGFPQSLAHPATTDAIIRVISPISVSSIPKDMYCQHQSTIISPIFFVLHIHHIPHSTKPTRAAQHIVFVIQLSHPLLVHGLPNHLFHILISLIVHVFH